MGAYQDLEAYLDEQEALSEAFKRRVVSLVLACTEHARDVGREEGKRMAQPVAVFEPDDGEEL